MGGRVLDNGIINAEVTEAYLGDDEDEGDINVTIASKGQTDCAHPLMDPYIVCECCQERVYCKLCFYQGSARQCAAGHYVGPCCQRNRAFNNLLACGICGEPLLNPPSPENSDRTPVASFTFPVSPWLIVPGVFLFLLVILPGWAVFTSLFIISLFLPEMARFGSEVVKRRLLEPKDK
jgi:hypothetical protein